MRFFILSSLILARLAAQEPTPPPAQGSVRSARVWSLEELKKSRASLDGQVVRLRIERSKLKSPGRNTSGKAFYTAETTRLLLDTPVAKILPPMLEDPKLPSTLVLNARVAATGAEWILVEEIVIEKAVNLPEPVNEKPLPFGKAVADVDLYKDQVVRVEFDPTRAQVAVDATRYGEFYTYIKHEADPGHKDSTYVTIRQADSVAFNKLRDTKRTSLSLYLTKDPKWGWMFVGKEWDPIAKVYKW